MNRFKLIATYPSDGYQVEHYAETYSQICTMADSFRRIDCGVEIWEIYNGHIDIDGRDA